MIALACVLAALGILTLPLGPRGHLNTRDYSDAPRWQVETFNAAVLVLTLGALAGAVLGLLSAAATRPVAIGAGLAALALLGSARAGWFPQTASRKPMTIVVLEVIDLALAVLAVVLGITGTGF